MKSDLVKPPDNPVEPSVALHFIPLSETFGAQVSGLDLSSDISDIVKSALNQALLDHQVLLFRQQDLNEDQQVRVAEVFGPCRPLWQNQFYPSQNNRAHYLSNVDMEGRPIGRHPDPGSTHWHSDGSWSVNPSKATVLYGIRVPEGEGVTHFANMYQLYEDLDQPAKDRLRKLQAEHNYELARAARQKRLPWQWSRADLNVQSLLMHVTWWKSVIGRRFRDGAVFHPIVRPHPETGRPALYIGDHAWRVRGRFWPSGIKLMKEINSIRFNASARYDHKWQPGDLLVWDNRSVLHKVGPYNFLDQVRIMRRCVVES